MSILDKLANRIDSFGGLFFEETEVARYMTVAGSDAGFVIPDPTTGVSDRHIQQIHLPGLVTGIFPVLFFRTTHTGRPDISIRVNTTRVFTTTLSSDGPHTWHEILPAGALREQDNEMVLNAGGEGVVTFSDIVILYTSSKLTVRREPVLTQ
ncbi:MAG TPA: hypothetical protein VGE02_13290 [Gemmatimonadales bacterium]